MKSTKRFRRLLLSGLLFLAPGLCFSQVGQQWVRTYNSPDNGSDEPTAMIVDGNGNIYVTRHSESWENGSHNALLKYDAAGNILWEKTYSGDNSFGGSALAVDPSGNVYVTGSKANSGTNSDYATIKYDKDGKELWVKTYDGPAHEGDGARFIAVDTVGNVYVTGISSGIGSSWDYATIKYDTNGNELWVKRYDGPGNYLDETTSFAIDASGNVYVTGSSPARGSNQVGLYNYDYATIKYDTNGNELWIKRYNGPGNNRDIAKSLAVDASGNVYITGYHQINNEALYDYATIKYNKDGKEVWVKTYDGPGHSQDFGASVAVDRSGNVYVTGSSAEDIAENGYNSFDYATVKYDSSGKELWVKRFNDPKVGDQFTPRLALDTAGNAYIAGKSSYYFTTIKYNSDGGEAWITRYDAGSLNEFEPPVFLAVDPLNNIYVAGATGSEDDESSLDFALIKYVQAQPTWYRDADKDGHGNAAISRQSAEQPAGYVTDSTDCNDNDADIHPGAKEVCDGKDNNCNGEIDENNACHVITVTCPNGDTTVKGASGGACTAVLSFAGPIVESSLDVEGSFYYSLSGATTVAGSTGEVNEEAFNVGVTVVTYYAQDIQGNIDSCSFKVTVLPADEICNGKDDDCDGLIDEDCNTGTTWYRDADGDGWGNPNSTKVAATQPKGYVSNKLDCDDKNKTKGGPEVCDGRDNDCDGIIDNGFDKQPFYSDWDHDGYGTPKRMKMACAAPPEYVSNAKDFNDDNATVYPGAPELCDGRDNDQNGKIDDGLPQRPFYWDHDKDGYGFFRPVYACAAPRGYISVGGDFNDNDSSIHPGAVEHCDGVDEDCDGVIDNGFPQKRFYKDKDSDGWGSNSNEMAGCAPPGYVENNGDCNDQDASIHPGAIEVPNNGIDDNCNGQVDEVITIVTQNRAAGVKSPVVTELHLTAVPNPTTHYFTLHINGNSNQPVQLRIVDALGRTVEVKQGLASNTAVPIGHNYRPGVYYAEAVQEGKKATIKLLKTVQ